MPADLLAQAAPTPTSTAWDAGSVRHLLPTVSDDRILIKVSFNGPLAEAPTLRVGDTTVRGRMSDTRGAFWHFDAAGLRPARPYGLSLVGEQCPRCGERLAKSSTARNTPGARPGLGTLGARSRLSSST